MSKRRMTQYEMELIDLVKNRDRRIMELEIEVEALEHTLDDVTNKLILEREKAYTVEQILEAFDREGTNF